MNRGSYLVKLHNRCRHCAEPARGSLYGWTLFLVIQTGTLAAVNIALAKFLGLIFPFISSSAKLIEIGNYSLSIQQKKMSLLKLDLL